MTNVIRSRDCSPPATFLRIRMARTDWEVLLDACLFGTRSAVAMAARIVNDPVNDPMAEEPMEDAGVDVVERTASARTAEIKDLLVTAPEDDEAGRDNPYQLMADRDR